MLPTAEKFESVRFGPYLLVSRLGKGGMAEVYKARMAGAHGFEKVVCVKRILAKHNADKHFVEMFINEARISARLSHPNVVQVFDLGEVDGEFYMAMEFVHGRDLLRVMRDSTRKLGGKPPPHNVAAYIAREACRALSHAHEFTGDDGRTVPIVHRDVSPQNVMVSFDGVIKVVDFGIAKAAQSQLEEQVEETRTGVLKGKFAYMAPEQLDGKRASPLTDIFAAGVVLFEMLTAKRLFKGVNDLDTLARVKTQAIPRPSEYAPVPPELDRIVLMALERDPAARYQRAAHMARDLEQFCGREGFTADDMVTFMSELYPEREEVPDGVVAQATPISKSASAAIPQPIEMGGGSKRTPAQPTLQLKAMSGEHHDSHDPHDAAMQRSPRDSLPPAVPYLEMPAPEEAPAEPGLGTAATVAAPVQMAVRSISTSMASQKRSGTNPGSSPSLRMPAGAAPKPASEPTGLAAAPEPAPPKRSRGVLLFAGLGAAVLLAGGGAAIVLGRNAPVAAPQQIAAPPPAAPEPAPAVVPPAPVAAPPVAPPSAPMTVRVDSVPPGAEVLDGPRDLGKTPVEIRFSPDRPSIALKLVKKGFEDLAYSVSPHDGPEVKLRLTPAKRRRGGRDDDEPAGPKVEVLPDED